MAVISETLQLFTGTSQSETITGSSVDLFTDANRAVIRSIRGGGQNNIGMSCEVTASTGGTPTWTAKLQTSVDNSNWVDAFNDLTLVSGDGYEADIWGAPTAAVSGVMRYVRTVVTYGGTGNSTVTVNLLY